MVNGYTAKVFQVISGNTATTIYNGGFNYSCGTTGITVVDKTGTVKKVNV